VLCSKVLLLGLSREAAGSAARGPLRRCSSTSPAAGTPRQHWQFVHQQLGMSAQQKQHIAGAYRHLLQHMVPVLQQRQQLAVQLAAAARPGSINYLELSKGGLQVRGGGVGGQGRAGLAGWLAGWLAGSSTCAGSAVSTHGLCAALEPLDQHLGPATPSPSLHPRPHPSTTLQAKAVTDALQANIQSENSLKMQFAGLFARHILSDGQRAKALVYSYPYAPDCLALAEALEAGPGQEEGLAPGPGPGPGPGLGQL
jgi:hypothetical protein